MLTLSFADMVHIRQLAEHALASSDAVATEAVLAEAIALLKSADGLHQDVPPDAFESLGRLASRADLAARIAVESRIADLLRTRDGHGPSAAHWDYRVALSLEKSGSLEHARARLLQALEDASAAEEPHLRALCLGALCALLIRLQDWIALTAHARDYDELLRRLRPDRFPFEARYVLCYGLVGTGDAPGARSAIAGVLAFLDTKNPRAKGVVVVRREMDALLDRIASSVS